MDIVEFDRIAVLESLRLVEKASQDDWERPTPCAEWNLRQLVSHMAGQHEGFAASAAGGAGDLDAWRDRPLGSRPYDTYRESAQRVLDAFAGDGILERSFRLPEVIPDFDFPASVAIGFHFLDYVVHAWDVATALGIPLELPDHVIEEALRIAALVPDDASRRVPGAAFQPSVDLPSGAPPLDRLVVMLGRTLPGAGPSGARRVA
ncbi:TIGR03086 family metal-binding protein [Streptomyces sp. NPDC005336]|uniref:TIGR03086 family metal-binding protein n=1 Tax=Streptomyces sp. NPDC005336 TaxID=3157035 RepID=UPI0033B99325